MSLKIVEGDKDIVLSNTLMNDTEGKASTNYYDFTVEGTSNFVLDLNYYLYLVSDEKGNSVDSKYVKIYLTKIENNTETVVVNPISLDNLNNFGDYKLITQSVFNFTSNVKTSKSTNYRLRAWLSNDAVVSNKVDPSINKTDDGVNISGVSGGYKFSIGVIK